MIKVLCFPLTKMLFFATGFFGTASMLRANSVTFEAVFRTNADWLNDLMRFGFLPGAFVFISSVALLFLAVWKTTAKANKEMFFRMWRSLDGALLLLIAGYVSLFLFSTAYESWTELGVIVLPVLAYAVMILALIEIVARLRDKEFTNTFY